MSKASGAPGIIRVVQKSALISRALQLRIRIAISGEHGVLAATEPRTAPRRSVF
jgi:hypothetical protein